MNGSAATRNSREPMRGPARRRGTSARAALAVRDIAAVYRALTRLGISQHRIDTLVRQSQSEVSEIVKGRVVKEYESRYGALPIEAGEQPRPAEPLPTGG